MEYRLCKAFLFSGFSLLPYVLSPFYSKTIISNLRFILRPLEHAELCALGAVILSQLFL